MLGTAIVDWTDPPDLVVEAFSPPVILAQSGEMITFTDITANIGTGSSGPSITSYYISETEEFDINTAIFVGNRDVLPLQPGEVDEQLVEQFTQSTAIQLKAQSGTNKMEINAAKKAA